MAKHFMAGTRLENLERMMMDPSRSVDPPHPVRPRQKGRCPQPGKPDKPPKQKEGGRE